MGKMSCKAANLCIANRYGQVLVQATMDAARPVTAGEVTLGLFGISREEFIPWAGGVPVYGTVRVSVGKTGVNGSAGPW